ncbi:MAG: ribosome assembly cofactor RimP [Bacteroidales bacterium]|jgi:ribosome maturation factor RimP|nr:ribosome assembly cofactor RimP [Bacteroidales bacterium]
MISKEVVKEVVLSAIGGGAIFMVDASVDASGRIRVEADTPEGITIDECAALSKAIEAQLDRYGGEFELEVSSPGLTSPLKVAEQYRKNCGRTVEVMKENGQKISGKLKFVNDEGIVLEITVKTKTEGSKRLQTEHKDQPLSFKEIKSTRVAINFN